MLIDTRPTASVTLKKNFDEPIDLRYLRLENSKELDFVVMSEIFINKDS